MARAEWRWPHAATDLRQYGESLSSDAVHLWLASLNQRELRLPELADLLAPDERERASRFRFVRDRERFVAARGQLRILLAAYANRPPAALAFSYGEHGKPALFKSPRSSDLRFNLSHSGDVVLYAIALGREVGVDLELIRPISEMAEIVDRWFPEQESERFHALPEKEKVRAFFALWTRREALLKGGGEGMSAIADAGAVISDRAWHGAAVPSRAFTAPKGWTLRSPNPAPNYVAALAVEGGRVELRYWQWDGTDERRRSDHSAYKVGGSR